MRSAVPAAVLRRRHAGVLALVAFGTACGTEITSTREGALEVIEEVTFAPSLEIDLSAMTRLPSGVYVEDLVVGSGNSLALGDHADVRYVGWLRTGVQFTQGETRFLMGNREVIAGFEQGVTGMKAGGSRRMIIPPALAFGNALNGAVPPGAVVIYEVELTAIERPAG
jgi:FKBP-type peptidyl-prolyl cis-trans isomerase